MISPPSPYRPRKSADAARTVPRPDTAQWHANTLLSPPQLYAYLQISERLGEKLLARGELPPASRISERRLVFRFGDVVTWLEARKLASRGATP